MQATQINSRESSVRQLTSVLIDKCTQEDVGVAVAGASISAPAVMVTGKNASSVPVKTNVDVVLVAIPSYSRFCLIRHDAEVEPSRKQDVVTVSVMPRMVGVRTIC